MKLRKNNQLLIDDDVKQTHIFGQTTNMQLIRPNHKSRQYLTEFWFLSHLLKIMLKYILIHYYLFALY